ncbi:hypothetical protein NJ75_02549 [Novosphingobium subterraneum]|uniref:Uncharacterized protein n=1 Tax=Novosphingobium subterraneum TaxID=48936 RepID=A0A0B8ZQW7_9SPHN|nr:hypothetical protein NJ75_02549 [Novosphingobium subterraneum]
MVTSPNETLLLVEPTGAETWIAAEPDVALPVERAPTPEVASLSKEVEFAKTLPLVTVSETLPATASSPTVSGNSASPFIGSVWIAPIAVDVRLRPPLTESPASPATDTATLPALAPFADASDSPPSTETKLPLSILADRSPRASNVALPFTTVDEVVASISMPPLARPTSVLVDPSEPIVRFETTREASLPTIAFGSIAPDAILYPAESTTEPSTTSAVVALS